MIPHALGAGFLRMMVDAKPIAMDHRRLVIRPPVICAYQSSK
jgi:hypothetical protein